MSRFGSRFGQIRASSPTPQHSSWTESWLMRKQIVSALAALARERQYDREAHCEIPEPLQDAMKVYLQPLCLLFHRHPSTVCDLPRGHKGKHVAHDLEGRIAAEWTK
jgi:hypothetical protein